MCSIYLMTIDSVYVNQRENIYVINILSDKLTNASNSYNILLYSSLEYAEKK